MEDPNTTKNLRSKEKSQLMIEGVMENQQNPSKKQDIPINISIVSSADNISHNAFAISLKKNKKIDVILPVIAEFQIVDVDALNFEVFWDPNAFGDKFTPNALPNTYKIPDGVLYRLRVVCNHAGDKKTLFERIFMSKKVASPDRNTFATGKSHQWLWHYQSLMPKCTTVKQAPQSAAQTAS